MVDDMGDCCSPVEFKVPAPATRQRRVLIAVLAINVVTFLMMVAGSLLSGSSSLLSGTLDNLGDALTYAMSLAVIGAASATKARVAFFKGLLILTAAIALLLMFLLSAARVLRNAWREMRSTVATV